ncbi:hypothetical protein VS883_29045, partial [Escherichia coli]
AFLALSLFGDESTARDLTTQILAWPQEANLPVLSVAFLALSLFGDESTARDLTTQILAWPQEANLPVL